MKTEHLTLTPGPVNGERHLTLYRFGTPGARPRVYIQGGLHADEAPGMVVGFALRDQLKQLEAEGRLRGEVLLVPVANPIGLDQGMIGGSFGRFEVTSGQNFNRAFPDAAALALAIDAATPEGDYVAALRARMAAALDGLAPLTPLVALQRRLLQLAIEADIVLDMHCDSEAVTHVYCHSEQADRATKFGRAIGAEAVLHAPLQGGYSFDEACTLPWIRFRELWPTADLPIGCFAVTLEWRGVLDTDPAVAQDDARAVIAWLAEEGVLTEQISGSRAGSVVPKPLAGVEVVTAPVAGLFHAEVAPGEAVDAGATIGHLMRLPDGELVPLRAGIDGLVYACELTRVVRAGAELYFIAGSRPIRDGMLLST